MTQRRDNFGQWQKYATIHIKKHLEEMAEKTERNLIDEVGEKLLECYKDNVKQSYGSRHTGAAQDIAYNAQAERREQEYNKGKYGKDRKRFKRKRIPYINTGKFEESIILVKKEHKVQIEIQDLKYPNQNPNKKKLTTTKDVYKYLTEGTSPKENGKQYRFKSKSGKLPIGTNYPTPKHFFEEHTMVQMLGYLDSLENDIKKGNYSK